MIQNDSQDYHGSKVSLLIQSTRELQKRLQSAGPPIRVHESPAISRLIVHVLYNTQEQESPLQYTVGDKSTTKLCAPKVGA